MNMPPHHHDKVPDCTLLLLLHIERLMIAPPRGVLMLKGVLPQHARGVRMHCYAVRLKERLTVLRQLVCAFMTDGMSSPDATKAVHRLATTPTPSPSPTPTHHNGSFSL